MYVKLLSNLDIHGAGIERIAGMTTPPITTSPTDEGKVMQAKYFDPVILYLFES